MPTIRRRIHGSTRGEYPVACSVCGVPWPRKQLRLTAANLLVCPDEGAGLEALELGRLNAQGARSPLSHVNRSLGAPFNFGEEAPPYPNWHPGDGNPNTLIADAGPNASPTYGVATALAGSATGGTPPYTYLWSVVSKASAGTVVVISDTAIATPNVTLTGALGSVTLGFQVTDSRGHIASDTVLLTLQATVLAAHAGPDAALTYGVATALAGSATGGTPPYTYLWEQWARTSETAVAIAAPTSATSNVTLDGPNGVITLRLTVTDALANTATDTVDLTLSATVSDIVGGILAYRWSANSLSDGAVSNWPNIVGGASPLTQGTAGKQPTRSATALDGLPGVTSADTARIMSATLSTPLAAGTRPYVFAVLKPTARLVDAQSQVLLKNAGYDSALNIYMKGTAAPTGARQTFYRLDTSGGGGADTISGYGRFVPQILHGGLTASGTSSAGFGMSYKDSTSTGTLVNPIDQLHLFADPTNPFSGSEVVISDVLVLTSSPTRRQVEGIVSVLADEWGVTHAPAHTASILCTDIDATLPVAALEWAFVASDGTYAYYVPNQAADKMLRQDVRKRQDDTSAWISRVMPGGDGTYAAGSLFVSPYLYVSNGHFWLRWDTRKDPSLFTVDAEWDSFDFRTVTNSDDGFYYENAFYDGLRYIYLPHTSWYGSPGVSHGKRILQYDTLGAGFTDPASYLASPDTVATWGITGWSGGDCDPTGQYAFFVSAYTIPRTGWKARYNKSAGLFSNAAAWEVFDTSTLNAHYIGYNDAMVASDGYVYYTHGEETNGLSDGRYTLRRPVTGAFNGVGWEVLDMNTLAPDAGTGTHGVNPGSSISDDRRFIAMPNESQHALWLIDTNGGFVASSVDFIDTQAYNPSPVSDAYNKYAGSCIVNGAAYFPPVVNNGWLLRVWLP